MMLTRADIDKLASTPGATLHVARTSVAPATDVVNLKPRNVTCERWRTNGALKTWKRDLARFRLPIKHGLYVYGVITDDNLPSIGQVAVVVTANDPCPHCGLTY